MGPWLPEPVETKDDPALGAEQAEALDMAVLLLLERLPPRERATYVLREAFDYSFREIAGILDTTEFNARQLAKRARKHLEDERHTPVDPAEHTRLPAAFMAAAQAGDFQRAGRMNGVDLHLDVHGRGRRTRGQLRNTRRAHWTHSPASTVD